MLRNEVVDTGVISDISAHKDVPDRIGFADVGEVIQIARVGQQIDVDN